METLTQILEEALDAGADAIQLEWASEGLEITYTKGNTGIGGILSDRKLAYDLLGYIADKAKLDAKIRGNMTVTVRGKGLAVRVKQYESFGQEAFELRIGKPKK